eukprot:CAMPEP_0184342834 /NCGR_PEP_ID=MMETSP1089-20130417/11406_1 /TAXON_ID=38269 ORGANISM="Gloeochaete wittrockiana, Strain SAG46.84" /NCGR_SAMPLE_ID=MMETSP1089 /ASSEMBLY_ACC=CAM_ASM_000445 /LENGTH=178 /DNA_ID=CAMNT_0026671867 /DNA_START=54 /DNA_END=590 /DNA_ORIENTATION=-
MKATEVTAALNVANVVVKSAAHALKQTDTSHLAHSNEDDEKENVTGRNGKQEDTDDQPSPTRTPTPSPSPPPRRRDRKNNSTTTLSEQSPSKRPARGSRLINPTLRQIKPDPPPPPPPPLGPPAAAEDIQWSQKAASSSIVIEPKPPINPRSNSMPVRRYGSQSPTTQDALPSPRNNF